MSVYTLHMPTWLRPQSEIQWQWVLWTLWRVLRSLSGSSLTRPLTEVGRTLCWRLQSVTLEAPATRSRQLSDCYPWRLNAVWRKSSRCTEIISFCRQATSQTQAGTCNRLGMLRKSWLSHLRNRLGRSQCYCNCSLCCNQGRNIGRHFHSTSEILQTWFSSLKRGESIQSNPTW